MYIERAHRMGRFKPGMCRPVIAVFWDYQDTEDIMSNARKLKGTKLWVNKDYPVDIVDARKALSSLLALLLYTLYLFPSLSLSLSLSLYSHSFTTLSLSLSPRTPSLLSLSLLALLLYSLFLYSHSFSTLSFSTRTPSLLSLSLSTHT